MANGLTPQQREEFAFHFSRREPVLSEEQKRRMNLDYTVRELLKTRLSAYEIIRHIFPEPERDPLAISHRRLEIRTVQELIREHDEQRLRQEEDRQKFLERVVPELLNDGYSLQEIYRIIWPTIEYITPRETAMVNQIIRLRTGNDAPDQKEAEKKTLASAMNKYLKYKSKYLSLKKNKVF
jgi:hypothetical protein